jgi:hypothetical protein
MARTLRGNYNPKQNANTRRNCGGKNTKNNRPKVNEQRGKEKKEKETTTTTTTTTTK